MSGPFEGMIVDIFVVPLPEGILPFAPGANERLSGREVEVSSVELFSNSLLRSGSLFHPS